MASPQEFAGLSKEEAVELLCKVTRERDYYRNELQEQKAQSLAAQNLVEQEEEYHINRMMKRLEGLREQQQNLANQVEQEEEFLTNNLQKRLKEVNNEKVVLENQLEAEQEYIVNKLHKELDHLHGERAKLTREKVDLENQLEAEQEYIVNRLQKQVYQLNKEKRNLQAESAELHKQLDQLKISVSKLNKDKVNLENQMEMEEENIVNRLQRQLSHVMGQYRGLERHLDQSGIPHQSFNLLRAARSDSWNWRELPWRGTNVSGSHSFNNRGKAFGSQDSTKSY